MASPPSDPLDDPTNDPYYQPHPYSIMSAEPLEEAPQHIFDEPPPHAFIYPTYFPIPPPAGGSPDTYYPPHPQQFQYFPSPYAQWPDPNAGMSPQDWFEQYSQPIIPPSEEFFQDPLYPFTLPLRPKPSNSSRPQTPAPSSPASSTSSVELVGALVRHGIAAPNSIIVRPSPAYEDSDSEEDFGLDLEKDFPALSISRPTALSVDITASPALEIPGAAPAIPLPFIRSFPATAATSKAAPPASALRAKPAVSPAVVPAVISAPPRPRPKPKRPPQQQRESTAPEKQTSKKMPKKPSAAAARRTPTRLFSSSWLELMMDAEREESDMLGPIEEVASEDDDREGPAGAAFWPKVVSRKKVVARVPSPEYVFPVLPPVPRVEPVWPELIESGSMRVIDTISVGPDDPANKWDDTYADACNAIDAVYQARRGQRGLLAELGLAESLCQSIWKAPTRGAEDRAKDGLPSYHKQLQMLSQLTTHLNRSLSLVDRSVAASLKQNWSKMMQRVWDEPGNTLESKNHDGHIIVCTLVKQLLDADPSFSSVLEDERDITISLLARYWAHSTAAPALNANAKLLNGFMDSSDPENPSDEPAKPHKAPPSMLDRIVKGVNDSQTQLISKFTSHLSWLQLDDIFPCVTFLQLCLALIIKLPGTDTPFYRAIRESVPLWKQIFQALQRTSAKLDPNIPVTDAQGMGARRALLCLYAYLVHIMFNTLYELRLRTLESDMMNLIEVWIHAGLLETLDQAVAEGAKAASGRRLQQLAGIMSYVSLTAQSDDVVRTLLIPQVPRPRMLRGFVDWHARDKRKNRVDRDPDHPWAITPWAGLLTLHSTCQIPVLCTRRGCIKRWVANCAKCKGARAKYCGRDCQVQDWKEHKLVCGLSLL
ncbi:hypothetical protein BOTBODRAFT_32979 [Botryobasidium botryosum FD-172 SS1]|uniref:MYND-type domain-containing protein n=1 Tax=Botryobasidium botryosum (strain FD-172 SS1) TaxID=930990 RepID=A0A067MQP0_BOTB1|nr:hypothetical protein BOTBODRAFT_32979 [Botryobasidium botryosum FD-172 SS1]